MKLSVNTGFLVNRYPVPSQWAKIISDLQVKHIQLTSDLFSPYYDDHILDKYVKEISSLKEKYGFSQRISMEKIWKFTHQIKFQQTKFCGA